MASFDGGNIFFLNGLLNNLPNFITRSKMYFPCKNLITFSQDFPLAYSYFAIFRIWQTSISLGQNSLHFPHFKHISIYLLILFDNSKSPLVTP